MPLYSLTCGNCLADNNVSASDDPIDWICNSCGNENSSSLPNTPTGDLITDPAKADAILDPTETAQATDVVVGEVIDDGSTD